MTAEACYNFYIKRKKTLSIINNRKWKNRILRFRRSKPNPRIGGWFVSPNGSSENTGRRFDQPIDIDTLRQIKLKDGDKIYFEAGHIYNWNQKSVTTILTLGRYGTGADPKLRGSDDASTLSWSDLGGGLYSASVAVEPKWVTINGECAKNAETARIPIVDRTSTTSVTIAHAAVSGYTSIVGAYLVEKDTRFSNSYRVTVTNYNGAGVITNNGAIENLTNQDLVLYNKAEFLNGNNQWAWESGTLYVQAAANPSTLAIRIITNDYCFKSTANLTASDLEIQEYYTAALWNDQGIPNIQNCTFHDIRDMAVLVQRKVTGANVSNNTFLRIGNCAIGSRPCDSSFYNDNTITDIGMQENYGWQTWASGGATAVPNVSNSGIAYFRDKEDDDLDGTTCEFNGNTISNVAYCAISVSIGTGNTINYNQVNGFMRRFEDGAALYTYHYKPYYVAQENTEISYNIIHDNTGTELGVGIYCDERTVAANVHHNTIYDVRDDWAIFFNQGTANHTVEDNNIMVAGVDGVGIVFRVSDSDPLWPYGSNINNQCNRNTIACTRSGQRCMHFSVGVGSWGTWNPYSGTGGANNNVYIKIAGPGAGTIASSDNDGDMTLAQLQTNLGKDAASVKLLANPVMFINSTASTSNEDAQGDYNDSAGSPVTTYTIAANYSRILTEISYSNFFESANTEYLTAGTAADIQFTNTDEYTIAVRFKLPANPGVAYALVDNRTAATRGYALQVNTSGFLQFQATNTVATNRLLFIHNVDVADNAWHQFIVMKDATPANSRYWLDGVEIFNVSGSNNLTATTVSTDALTIGRANPGGTTMDGYLKDVAIWLGDKSALISTIYNVGRSIDYRLTMPDDLPLHYWRLGESPSLVDGYEDVGTSATPLDLTAVNGVSASTDTP